MNWIRITDTKKVQLVGLSVNFEKENDSVREVTITDAEGNQLKVRGDYGVSVVIPAPPVKKKKFIVYGELLGGVASVNKQFDHEHEAERFILDTVEKTGKTRDDLGLMVEEKEILVEA